MGQQPPSIARVGIPSPLRRLFDYRIPPALSGNLKPGCRVRVPFGQRQVVGLVLALDNNSDFNGEQLKPVDELLDQQPLLPGKLLQLFIWAAHYYQHPPGDALLNTLPVALRKGETLPPRGVPGWRITQTGLGIGSDSLKRAKKQKALIEEFLQNDTLPDADLLTRYSRTILKQLEEKSLIEPVRMDAEAGATCELLREAPLALYESQQQAVEQIELHGFNCYLLDGVTGSGKTEVYLQCIEKVLRYGRQALVLIPEISLTPQTEQRFRARFNVPLVTLHSGLNDNERLVAWSAAANGEARIVLGTRSAIFTPLPDPGVIIVDEEHDSSYKQQEGFRYSARDLSVIRGNREGIPVILGSATPSLESLHNCQAGRYRHLVLSQRAGGAAKPRWQLVDLRRESTTAGITPSTAAAIRRTLDAGQQVLLFLNRRGFAPSLLCHHCGWCAECRRCDARLTLHKGRNLLICHHCEYQQRPHRQCPSCKSDQLLPLGEGTERSEEHLQSQFPDVPVLRVDRDTTRRKSAMEDLYTLASDGNPCILLGTQMLAKGHHFPNVTLVAVLDADSGLFSPDFRGHERFAQLLTQVAGRSGRGDQPGEVLIQTHQPDHPLLQQLMQSGFGPVAQHLLAQRQTMDMPPCRHLAVIRAESSRAENAEQFLRQAALIARRLQRPTPQLSYLGPLPALMEKRSGRYRYLLQISASARPALQSLLGALVEELDKLPDGKRVRWAVDVDPQEM